MCSITDNKASIFAILILIYGSLLFPTVQGATEKEKKFVTCHNDQYCHLFGDCCKSMKNAGDTKEIVGECSDNYYSEIVRCPGQFGNTIVKELCENDYSDTDHLVRFLKVYNQNSGLLYKNKFCAMCNNIVDYKQVAFTLWCKKGRKINNVKEIKKGIVNKKCSQAIFSYNNQQTNNPGLIYRLCYINTIRTCNDSNHASAGKCLSEATYYVKDIFSGRYFKNKYCCECNPPIKKMKHCLDLRKAYTHQTTQFGNDGTYTMLLDFNQWCGDECDPPPSMPCDNCTGNLTGTSALSTYSKSTFSVLTILFCLISIIGLLVLITTYALIKDLRNFGGLITIALSATILFSQLVFLIAADSRDRWFRCKLFAALLHFSYLSSFIWMIIFAVDLLKTFYSTGSFRGKPKQRIIKCCLAAFGIPFVVIVIGFILDATVPDCPVSPNYGTKICFFNKFWGGIVWFYMPVSLIIIFNIGACIAAFIYLYKASKDGKRARSESSKEKTSTFILCLKLSALFGVFWMLLIIAVLVNDEITKEICGLINCLQGFLISVCFMATKRVKKAAKESLSKFSSTTHRSDHGVNTRSAIKYSAPTSPNTTKETY